MRINLLFFVYSLIVALVLSGCGGGSSGGSPSVSSASTGLSSSSSSTSIMSSSSSSVVSSSSLAGEETGVFAGTVIEGLAYSTETRSGFTDAEGQFKYTSGENITFSIGGIQFPTISAASEITPFSFGENTRTDDVVAINIASLLQTLDLDGDFLNGISLTPEMQSIAEGINIDFSSSDFALLVGNIVSSSGGVQNMLIDPLLAINNVLNALYPPYECTSDHNRVGQFASLSNRAHGVSGDAQIVNDCTVRLTNFNYDGGGLPDVFIYSGENGNYTAGTALSDNIYGLPFENGVLNIFIPSIGQLNQLDGISVWCVRAGVDFGSGEFVAF